MDEDIHNKWFLLGFLYGYSTYSSLSEALVGTTPAREHTARTSSVASSWLNARKRRGFGFAFFVAGERPLVRSSTSKDTPSTPVRTPPTSMNAYLTKRDR